MAETRPELGRAVAEALEWLGATPETAGAALGINGRTLGAMVQGIVPMRSLVIRFASGLARQCERREGGQKWWPDVDAWLNLAGYSPRRDMAPDESRFSAPPRQMPPPGGAGHAAPAPRFAPPSPPSPEHDPPAAEYYRPVYERQTMGDVVLHVFWILDRDAVKRFQMVIKPDQDYKAEAAIVKRDLATMTRSHFDRKYRSFRAESAETTAEA